MLDALAYSIARTSADVLGQRGDTRGGRAISDETIGLQLWFERGFHDHDALVQLINHTRRIIDERPPPQPAPPPYRCPVQLSLDLEVA